MHFHATTLFFLQSFAGVSNTFQASVVRQFAEDFFPASLSKSAEEGRDEKNTQEQRREKNA